jgi:plastocyanin
MRRLPYLTVAALFVLVGPSLAIAPTDTPLVPTVPATRGATVLAASDSISVEIVEPPFKPPATWTYEPAVVTVKVGTTVTWINMGAVVHTVTADDGKTFDSGVMRRNATFKLTTTSSGKFTYHCTYHRWMKGTLIVEP